MRLLLAVVTFLIVYGSLYPFGIDARQYQPAMLDALFDFGLNKSGRGDLVENILLFVPFGFLAIKVFPGRSFALRLVFVSSIAFTLAFLLQVAQLLIPGRVPAGADSIWNVIGCVGGCVLGRIRLGRRFDRVIGLSVPPDVGVLLALAWIIFGFAPFVPSIDWQLMKDHARALLNWPPNGVWVIQSCVMWLVVFHFLRRSTILLFRPKYYLPIVAFTLASGFLLIGQTVSSDKLLGSSLALVLWFLLGKRIGSVSLATLLVVVIVGVNFTPFELRAQVASFSWVPFSGALTGNMFVNVLAVLKKLVLYGSLIWLMTESGLRLRIATAVVAVLLFLSEYAQIFFVGSKPEITDALLALALGAAFRSYTQWTTRFSHLDVQSFSAAGTGNRDSASIDIEPISGVKRGRGSRDYLPGLDGLRAWAAFAVFLVHFNQQVGLKAELGPFDLARWFANGNTGVALFFVLSGFLLAMPFWREQYASGPRLDVKLYVVRRLARILPAYYLCLGGILAIKAGVGGFPSVNNVLSHVLFLYNVNDHNILSLNEPFWTLAVEMQFYLLLPFLMLGMRNCSQRAALLWLLAFAIGSYLLNFGLVSYLLARDEWPIRFTLIWPISLYISGPGSFVLTYSTLAHLSYFFIGIAAALLYVAGPAWLTRLSSASADLVFWVCALFLFAILSTPLDELLQAPHGHYNWPAVPLLLAVMIFVTPKSMLARAILESRPLRAFGIVSYGIYIFHYPVQKAVGRGMRLLGYSVEVQWLLFGIVSLGLSVMVATASYLLLERPIMRWVRRQRPEPMRNNASVPDAMIDAAPAHARSSAGNALDGDWINVSVRLASTHVSKLRRIASAQGGSISGAARSVLADFMAEAKEAIDSSAGVGITPPVADAARDVHTSEEVRINLRKWQYDGLSSMAAKSGKSVEALVEAVISSCPSVS